MAGGQGVALNLTQLLILPIERNDMVRVRVREYKKSDKDQLIDCIVALQNFERTLDKNKVPGKIIAKKYFKLLTFGRRSDRAIFIADIDGKVAGFVAVKMEKVGDDITSATKPYAYISDIFVWPKYRKRGTGESLFKRVENYVRTRDIGFIKFDALADNKPMRNLAKKMRFNKYEVSYLKKVN